MRAIPGGATYAGYAGDLEHVTGGPTEAMFERRTEDVDQLGVGVAEVPSPGRPPDDVGQVALRDEKGGQFGVGSR